MMSKVRTFKVEFEVTTTGLVFSEKDTKTMTMFGLEDGTTEMDKMVFINAVKKEALKQLKKAGNLRNLHVTIYGYDGNYNNVDMIRYTFWEVNGEIEVEYRVYDVGQNIYDVKEIIKTDDYKEVRNIIMDGVNRAFTENVHY